MKISMRNTKEGTSFTESYIKNIGLTKGHGSLKVFIKSWTEEDVVLINILEFQLCAEIII